MESLQKKADKSKLSNFMKKLRKGGDNGSRWVEHWSGVEKLFQAMQYFDANSFFRALKYYEQLKHRSKSFRQLYFSQEKENKELPIAKKFVSERKLWTLSQRNGFSNTTKPTKSWTTMEKMSCCCKWKFLETKPFVLQLFKNIKIRRPSQ